MNVLVVNSGSSSIRCKLMAVQPGATPTDPMTAAISFSAGVHKIGHEMFLMAQGHQERLDPCYSSDHAARVELILQRLKSADVHNSTSYSIDAIGHRVVHGGDEFRSPVRIDESVLNQLDHMEELAPLHNPGSLAAMKAMRAAMPDVPMVAVFDTAFHATIPPKAATYAIDHDMAKKYGIRRYGFHGIAHGSMARTAAVALGRPLGDLRLITLQLGNGCSACAIAGGHSADTSMGLTPLEGLVMGTRCGDLDPSVPMYLARHAGLPLHEIDRLLNEKAGLLGLSGLSADMRIVVAAAEEGHVRARLAIEVFAYRVRKYIGAYLAALGGADAIVFGGGIGEGSSLVRARICDGMAWCNVQLNTNRNAAAVNPRRGEAIDISEDTDGLQCLVAGVDEEGEIARATATALAVGG